MWTYPGGPPGVAPPVRLPHQHDYWPEAAAEVEIGGKRCESGARGCEVDGKPLELESLGRGVGLG